MRACEIFQYLTDREIKRENAADKFMIHAIAFVDDMHRQQSRERTHNALKRKMLAGHVAGGTSTGTATWTCSAPPASGPTCSA